MKLIRYFYILSLLFLFGCEKIPINYSVFSFKLNEKQYNFNGGNAEYLHDKFDFTQLVGGSEDFKNGIQIDFIEKKLSDYDMMSDTVAIYITIGSIDAFISSNWSNNRSYSKFGKSFQMRILHRDNEKITGVFSGVLYHLNTVQTTLPYEEIELKEGKFELMFK